MKTGYKILVTAFVVMFVVSLVSNYVQYAGNLPERTEKREVKDVDLIKIDDDKIVESSIISDDKNKKVEVITKVIERIPEGYVKLNLSEYRRNMAALSNFKKRYEELVNKRRNDLDIEVAESEVIDDKAMEDLVQLLNDIDTTASIKLEYQTMGFIFRPSWGIGYCDEADFTIGVKTFFWNKYNVGLYSTMNLGGIGIGRHLNDVIKIFKSTEIRAITGLGYKGGFRFWIGITTDM